MNVQSPGISLRRPRRAAEGSRAGVTWAQDDASESDNDVYRGQIIEMFAPEEIPIQSDLTQGNADLENAGVIKKGLFYEYIESK
jgi:hypothetical protein